MSHTPTRMARRFPLLEVTMASAVIIGYAALVMSPPVLGDERYPFTRILAQLDKMLEQTRDVQGMDPAASKPSMAAAPASTATPAP